MRQCQQDESPLYLVIKCRLEGIQRKEKYFYCKLKNLLILVSGVSVKVGVEESIVNAPLVPPAE
jgi:hypothetical protein